MLDAYKKLMTSPNFEENKDKYAPTVPHLMLYLEEGKLTYKDYSRIVIGGEKPLRWPWNRLIHTCNHCTPC